MKLTATCILATSDNPDHLSLWWLSAMMAFGGLILFSGVQTWRGVEPRTVSRLDPDDPRRQQWVFGGRRVYQSFLGAGLAWLPAGFGLILFVLGVSIRQALSKPQDWLPWYVISGGAFALIFSGFIYLMIYYWLGVPNCLRPPSQRDAPGGIWGRVTINDH